MDKEIPDEIEQNLDKRGGTAKLLKNIENKNIQEKVRINKALSNRIRLKILALLNQQDLCVCLLKEMLDIEDSKLSYHLSVLKDERLIEGERDANFVIYRIKEKGKKYAP